ncbi:SGNH/GDSL hydrolase family protein [Halalkalibacter okhensis]|uniref:SGNH hydrolase-type esterase domain-containing protein n=1 Tax=Halalkalibacter okhensis TaxID=333138 RepID=A0A0B0IFC7_9BACI|nr:SGNH/GDSL hydrolase family protein [Halalkalibacter okhensis]KHF39592.1 hypothetical protein LQ50_14200 [Halalkalibacter okhensis]
MKLFLFFSSIFFALAIIVGGHFYYQQKLDLIAEESAALTAGIVIESVEKDVEQSELAFSGLLHEWTNSIESHELDITVFGSTSIELDNQPNESWPYLLHSKLTTHYQAPAINLTVINAEGTFSIDVLRGNYLQQVVKSQPDVLFFEPFILNDNGHVRLEDSIDAIDLLLQSLSTSLPETVIVLIPPNPLFGANFYLTQLEQLKQFAQTNNILYVDHWPHWPSTDDEALNDYVENARPNAEGHKLWADAMLKMITQ